MYSASFANQADRQHPFKIKNRIITEIFVPATFLTNPNFNVQQPTMEIIYTGDDYGWPVYAIGFFRGCLDKKRGHPTPGCSHLWHALRLRAPELKSGRVRHDGSALASTIATIMNESPSLSFTDAVSKSGLKWEIATLNTCPGAVDTFGKFNMSLNSYINTDPNSRRDVFIHSDMVTIKVNLGQNKLALQSPVGLPVGKWVSEFDEILGQCWEPAAYPRPWETDKMISASDPKSSKN